MIARMTGGLGNQLFMYAFGRSVGHAHAGAMLGAMFHWQRSTWDYALDPFHLPITFQTPSGAEPIYEERSFAYDSDVYKADPSTYFRGYWQSEKYFFTGLIRNDFNQWLHSPWLNSLNYVAIHVRRGDYLNQGTKAFHGLLSEEYYQTAIEHIKSKVYNPSFVVFTDDSNMKNFLGYPVVSTGNQHLDLHTMARCSHHIMANSTYSWWAAWLGEKPGQVVVAPKQWFADSKIDTKDLIPERWVRL